MGSVCDGMSRYVVAVCDGMSRYVVAVCDGMSRLGLDIFKDKPS